MFIRTQILILQFYFYLTKLRLKMDIRVNKKIFTLLKLWRRCPELQSAPWQKQTSKSSPVRGCLWHPLLMTSPVCVSMAESQWEFLVVWPSLSVKGKSQVLREDKFYLFVGTIWIQQRNLCRTITSFNVDL